ncbi:toll/interleukin-1 receptor domain-containing protein [Nitrogeniibacter mangrovi]|uniref:Toll/interleukin-1 receptor domain-containing protein n=1 Tax=Nitrogeniibacter mangrovi TaxID=2016596 RepID=A0A6C1B6G3_9RHOO|nr:toll/interleukin-1 receptor domain-containing protein [Nitrogeniibacter mangrovi]QID19291.1 toll/interleukin-1 receptor domain-containing protein [Nitrogeniibacter mangrovi]
MEQGIFVSYRRQDSQSAAGRLTDRLKDLLPEVSIFRDVETIEPGVDFVEAIERALRSCGVLIAVIGPRWVAAAHDDGSRRLDDPNDYTRLEIATALKRGDVRVIPVLVEGAQMPGTAELPDDLAALARRNAIELSDKRWDFDVSTLVETLRKALGLPEAAPDRPSAPAPAPKGPPRRAWWIGGGIALLAVLGILGEDNGGMAPAPEMSYAPPVQTPARAPVAPSAMTAAPAGRVDLTGLWRDPDGGMHEIVQHGSDLVFRGRTPDGFVTGTGTVSGHQGQTTYMFNGYPLRSTFVVAADGQRMDVTIIDPATNERDATQLFRVR